MSNDYFPEGLKKYIDTIQERINSKELTEKEKEIIKKIAKDISKEEKTKRKRNYSKKKQKEVLTINQLSKFIENAKSIKEKLIIKTMFKCGLRVGELINFKISWINFEDALIRVQSNKKPIPWQPKNCSERELPIPKPLLIDLKQFIGNRRSGYIFQSRKKKNYRRYSEETIIRIINRISKIVLNKNTGSHIFRRTYASYLLANKMDVMSISKYLGHKHVRHTYVYLEQIPDRSTYEEVRNIDLMDV